MELRCLSERDMPQALLAHQELAAEEFDFLPGYDPGTEWKDFLELVEAARQGRRLPASHVAATFLIAEAENHIVGRVTIRHRLTPFLRTVGGHIGYVVRPGFRRRGYAQQMLGLALIEAKRLRIDQALLTCDAHNDASRTVIEKCGGVLEAPLETDAAMTMKLRYWIDT
ncbi:GNAT family N-acetyltransferase [uncultured Arthrobacter sp.]|uniref:GNAT family N-acetyltransferase n=1 Tax=uncultured Arthrobacter sp. TaxID=114050 RepID=UPI00260727C5|nr:GNAT family N-acetyltransferase [uncultured Arthrobacter sp.]